MDAVPLDLAIGGRVREIREAAGASREELARAAQRVGRNWGADRIAHMEAARASTSTIPTLVGLSAALAEVSGGPVTVRDLLPANGVIELADGWTIAAAALRAALSGQSVVVPPRIGTVTDPRLEPGWGAVDDRLVADLGTAPEVVRVATRELYGRSATQERDARAGDGATPQKRGRVTRGILTEVVKQVRHNVAADAAMDADDYR